MSKVGSSTIRAQAEEERLNLSRWLTKERINVIVKKISNNASEIEKSKNVALSGQRSCDCLVYYMDGQKNMRLLLKLKPISQSFQNALKQLKQEIFLYSNYCIKMGFVRGYTKMGIITYDTDRTDDEEMAEECVTIIRASDIPIDRLGEKYQAIDAV